MSFENATKSALKIVNKVFGKSVTYKYSVGGSDEIKGVFDNAFVEINGVSTLKPVLKIQLSDLSIDPVEDDQVLIGSVTYKVLDSQPDSHGATTLIIEKV